MDDFGDEVLIDQSTGRPLSQDEIATMRQSLNVIKVAASKRIKEKDAQIRALEDENARLRSASGGAVYGSSSARPSDLEEQLQALRLDQLNARNRLLHVEEEKNELMIKLVAAKQRAGDLEADTGDSQHRIRLLEERLKTYERNGSGAQLDRTAATQAALVDLQRAATERESRLNAILNLVARTRADLAQKDANLQSMGLDAPSEARALRERARLNDTVLAEIEGLDTEFELSASSMSPPGRGGSTSGSPTRASLESQNATWKTKADNLTTELQVLQRELRKHLAELRGDGAMGGSPNGSPARGPDPTTVVVEHRYGRGAETEAMRAEHLRLKEAERRRVEAGEPDDVVALAKQRAALASMLDKSGSGAGGRGAERSYGRLSAGQTQLTIKGAPIEGSTLTAAPHPSLGDGLTFVWRRRTSVRTVRVDVDGPQYLLTDADTDAMIEVTATNADGERTVAEAGPVEPASPEMLETWLVGAPLNTTVFELRYRYFGGAAGEHMFEWLKSTDGAVWSRIAAATGAEYQATVDDVGSYLRCEVTPIRSDGVVGSVVGQQTQLIEMDPDVAAAVDAAYESGAAEFPVFEGGEAAKLSLRRDKMVLRTRSDKFAYEYTPDTRATLNPTEHANMQLHASASESFDLDVSPQTSRQRDIVAYTLFRFARRHEAELYSKRDWARPAVAETRSITATKDAPTRSNNAAVAPAPQPVVDAARKQQQPKYQRHTDDERSAARARHADRKANMSPEEYAEWKRQRRELIRSSLSEAEYESWKADHREKAAIKGAVVASPAVQAANADAVKSAVASLKASVPPEEYHDLREDAKARSLKSVSEDESSRKRRRKHRKPTDGDAATQQAARAPTPSPNAAPETVAAGFAAAEQAAAAAADADASGSRKRRRHRSKGDEATPAAAPVAAPVAEPDDDESSKKKRRRHKSSAPADLGAPAAESAGEESSRKRRHKSKSAAAAPEAEPEPSGKAKKSKSASAAAAAAAPADSTKSGGADESSKKKEKPSWHNKDKSEMTPAELAAREAWKKEKIRKLKAKLSPEEYAEYKKTHNERRSEKAGKE